jgi:hypothetical protein
MQTTEGLMLVRSVIWILWEGPVVAARMSCIAGLDMDEMVEFVKASWMIAAGRLITKTFSSRR